MPVIRISDETLRRLKTWAEPLEDTAESAMSKALDAAEKLRRTSTRTQTEPETVKTQILDKRSGVESAERPSGKEFRKPLLRTIYEMGGSARTRDLYPVMEKHMTAVLLPGDFKNFSFGDRRWRNSIRRERLKLVNEGYLRDDSPRGIWELSEKGSKLIEKIVTEPPESFIKHLLSIPAVGDDADFDRDPSQPRTVRL